MLQLQTLPAEQTRPVALELAAVRMELQEVERRLTALSVFDAPLKEIRDRAVEAGEAISALCKGFENTVKDAFSAATSEFFVKADTAGHFAKQTDMARACVGFVVSLTRPLRADPCGEDELIAEADRRLELLDAVQAGEPVFEYPPNSTAATR